MGLNKYCIRAQLHQKGCNCGLQRFLSTIGLLFKSGGFGTANKIYKAKKVAVLGWIGKRIRLRHQPQLKDGHGMKPSPFPQ